MKWMLDALPAMLVFALFCYMYWYSNQDIDRCQHKMHAGWWCSRLLNHDGPCALRPCWWNFTRSAIHYRRWTL